MLITIIAWVAVIASAAGILLAGKLCRHEISREALQIVCSLVFCWVGTWQINSLLDIETASMGMVRPWRVIGMAMLAVTILLWWLSKRIK